jgi:NAD(P)-dependent dehydrogenase (short-subunit alcohol dehydrogenase family)
VDQADHEAFGEIGAAAGAPVNHLCIAIGGASEQEVVLDAGVLKGDHLNLLDGALATNVAEVIAITISMLPLLADDGSASVTIASSINASGDFGYPFYSTSKAAIEGFVASTARTLGQQAVRINAVSFGTVLTDRSHELHANDTTHYSRLERLTATGRLTSVKEAAISMVTMALDLTNVTGTVLTCDGGQSLSGEHSLP